jgi:hypothetical protein
MTEEKPSGYEKCETRIACLVPFYLRINKDSKIDIIIGPEKCPMKINYLMMGLS